MALRPCVALTLLLGGLACAQRPAVPPPPPPPAAFFWETVAPSGARVALLGSVHIGEERELWLDPRVEQAYQRAAALIVEVDTRHLSPYDALEATERYGLLPPEQSLGDVISPDLYRSLIAYLRAHHYPLDQVARMRPWLLTQLVAQIEFEAAGYDADNGVDAWFLRRADDTKPVEPLEDLDDQLSLFASLPPALEERLLREMLAETGGFVAITHAILRAWERGDEATLLALLLGGRNDPLLRAFHQRVFVERNYRMADRLAALAADGRDRFVVVGTGHLIGPESVPDLLLARGFAVTRVPDAFVRARPPPPPPLPELLPDATGPAPEPGAEGTPPPPPRRPDVLR